MATEAKPVTSAAAWFQDHADLADAACKLVFVQPSHGKEAPQPFKNVAILNTGTRKFRLHTGEQKGLTAALASMGNTSKRWNSVRIVGDSSLDGAAALCRFAVQNYPFERETFLKWDTPPSRPRAAAGAVPWARAPRKRSADEAFGAAERPKESAPRSRLVVPDGFVLERVSDADPNKRARIVYRHEASGTVLKSRRSAVKYAEGGEAALAKKPNKIKKSSVPPFGPGSGLKKAKSPRKRGAAPSAASGSASAGSAAKADNKRTAAAENKRAIFAATVVLPDDDDALWDADLMESSEENDNDPTPDLDDLFANFQSVKN
jgi:hypothetical protein